MSDKPIGVFVQLHDGLLNETQIAKLCNPKRNMTESLLAIGTPVAGGELETEVVRVREHRKDIELPWTYHKAPPSDQDASEYELEVDRLLTHKQALAKLAEKDAEIGRDSERLDWLLSRTHYGIPGFDPKVSGRSPSERKEALIRAIDAAMEGGE